MQFESHNPAIPSFEVALPLPTFAKVSTSGRTDVTTVMKRLSEIASPRCFGGVPLSCPALATLAAKLLLSPIRPRSRESSFAVARLISGDLGSPRVRSGNLG